MSTRDEESRKTASIIEVLDDLIYHLNTTKSTFSFMIVSSFIIAPLALIVAAIFILHPRFLLFMLERVPQVATVIIIFLVISVILASSWLAIGIKERAFFSAWSRRFSRFMTLKERIDRDLVEDGEQGSRERHSGKD